MTVTSPTPGRANSGGTRRLLGTFGGVFTPSILTMPWLIGAGVVSATLSSALASFLGASRILQALASDRLFKGMGPFSAVDPGTGNPRRAVVVTGLITVFTIVVGDLNAIASVVSMFFVISYGLLNYATYVEATAASPSFRPRFRLYDARASLLGTFLCGAVMLAIDPMAAAVAVALLFAGYQYLRWTAVPPRWRDSRRAYRYRKVKDGLQELTDLMTRNDEWDDAEIRVLAPAAADAEQKVAANLAYRLEERRIEATIDTVVDADVATVTERSRDASIVFLPLRVEGMRLLDPFGGPVDAMLRNLPLVALVAAAQDIQLRTEDEDEPPPVTDPASDARNA